MRKFIAVVGLCILVGSVVGGCSDNDSPCEKVCDRVYDGAEAKSCKDNCAN